MEKLLVGQVIDGLRNHDIKHSLDGRHGSNRTFSRHCQLNANNDFEAIGTWLSEYQDSPHTLRAYKREVERLLMWSFESKGRALSDLSREDILEYEQFLEDPQPGNKWCGPKRPRSHKEWKPFRGPLSQSSRRQALIIISSLFSYLTETNYLAGNPAARRGRGRRQPKSRFHANRFFDRKAWNFAKLCLSELPDSTKKERAKKERLRFLLAFGYLLGPRTSEYSSHSMGSIVRTSNGWRWQVIGKGGVEDQVPVNRDMLLALKRYRNHLGLPELPAPGEQTPLVFDLREKRGIGSSMIYRIYKDFFCYVAKRARWKASDLEPVFRSASPHWMRHTNVSHQFAAGIQSHHIRQNARHSDLATTSIYSHADELERQGSMEHLRF